MELEGDEFIDYAVELLNDHILPIDDQRKQSSVVSFMLALVLALNHDCEEDYLTSIDNHTEAMRDLYPTLASHAKTSELN